MGARILLGTLVLALGAAGTLVYGLLRATLEADVYRDRIAELGRDFEQLRGQYDQAVRRTAVTELVVEDGQLDVVVRSAAGELERIETSFDPRGEIYVDFVVLQGRLWIRRIFDASTPPATGLVIDPSLGQIDWQNDASAQGKATYRALAEGRWVVSVTGDGSLGLDRLAEGAPSNLAVAPVVRSYAPIGSAVDDRLGDLAPSEILRILGRRLLGRGLGAALRPGDTTEPSRPLAPHG